MSEFKKYFLLSFLLLILCSCSTFQGNTKYVYDIAHKTSVVELDEDDNGAIDVDKGGTNEQSVTNWLSVGGETQIQITDGYAQSPTGFIYRVVTTDSGHTLKIQVYDSNGSTWRDALTFTNGNSGDADANNWPRVSLGANVALTGLGNSALGVTWGSDISTNPTTLTYTGLNQLYFVTAAVTVNLPDVGSETTDAQYGEWIQFQVKDASETLTINPADDDIINRQGAAQSAGVSITSSGAAGDVITCVATTNADGSDGDGWMCRANVSLGAGS